MWWMMISMIAIVGAAAETPRMSCESARLKCAYRVGCGKALQNYLVGCSAVLQGPQPTYCPEICQHSLIALTSTEEGKELMRCECSDDDFCLDSKRRVEICRHQVTLATRNESVVSCTVAQWICDADALCSKALEYYNDYCRSMFHGKKCSHRCRNSISILRRQEKAAKLTTCRCDGQEDYDCPRIQSNMARLCFHAHPTHPEVISTTTTSERTISSVAGVSAVASSLLVAAVVALIWTVT